MLQAGPRRTPPARGRGAPHVGAPSLPSAPAHPAPVRRDGHPLGPLETRPLERTVEAPGVTAAWAAGCPLSPSAMPGPPAPTPYGPIHFPDRGPSAASTSALPLAVVPSDATGRRPGLAE